MGCNASTQQTLSPSLNKSRKNKALGKLPEKHRFHLRKQDTPHGITINNRITDFIAKNKQISQNTFRQQYSKSKALNSKYSDSFFPATIQALGPNYKQAFQWKSPQQFIEGQLSLFDQQMKTRKNPSLSYYFTSVIAVLSTRPQILKRIFENEQITSTGVYGIWLCIHVWLPTVDKSSFFISDQSTVAIHLLHKAYAKALKNYSNIETGIFGVCFSNITGCPYEYFNKSSTVKQTADQLWKFIDDQLSDNFIVVVSNQINDRNQILCGKPTYSYQVLDTKILTIKDKQQRLLKISNPLKMFDWTGRWSLKSKTWTSDLKSKLQYDDSEQYFWINIEDLHQNFKQACSCRYNKDSIYSFCKLRFKQSLKKGVFLTTDTTNKGYITISQKDHRTQDKDYKYGLIRLIVCEISKQQQILIRYVTDYLDAAQHFSVKLDLDPGKYYIALEANWMNDRARDLVVSFYGNHGVVMVEDNDLPKNINDFINQMIILHEKHTQKERIHKYSSDENISRVTGSIAGYIYYHYTNNSKVSKYLYQIVILQQKQFIQVQNGQNKQQFEVRVDPGEDVIMRLKVQPQGNGYYLYSTKIKFDVVQHFSLQKLKQMCNKNPTKVKKRQIDGKAIQVTVKTLSYSGGIVLLYQNKMDKYAYVQQLTLDMDNLILQNQTMNQRFMVDIQIQPHGQKILSFLIQKPGNKVSFKTNMSFHLDTPQFQF